MKKKCLAIIPARSGSKRILNKNIKNFFGQPIIKYSIDVAIKSNCFDEIMVSTNSEKIANIAKLYGAKVPFLRSDKSSDDYSTLSDVLVEVLLRYIEKNIKFEYFCCILATAPFVSKEKILKAFNILKNNNIDSVVPVVEFKPSIFRSFEIINGRLNMIYLENLNVRSQDLKSVYYDSGQFYWMRSESFLREKRIFTENTIPMILSSLESQDIDTNEDWKLAEIKYKLLNS